MRGGDGDGDGDGFVVVRHGTQRRRKGRGAKSETGDKVKQRKGGEGEIGVMRSREEVSMLMETYQREIETTRAELLDCVVGGIRAFIQSRQQRPSECSSTSIKPELEVTCIGLGSLFNAATKNAVIQSALLALVVREIKTSDLGEACVISSIEAYDPVFVEEDSSLLQALGITSHATRFDFMKNPAVQNAQVTADDQSKELRLKLYFMPHCEKDLYNKLIEAEAESRTLHKCCIIGNSFKAYVANSWTDLATQSSSLNHGSCWSNCKTVEEVADMVEEVKLPMQAVDKKRVTAYYAALNGTSLMYLPGQREREKM